MANDRNDFLPEVRNAAWWSGDSRMAANGRAGEAILQKLGLMDRPDLSDVEAVQMGHVMQPVIGRLAEARLRLELKEADYALSHASEPWLQSHFDFISADGSTLVEAKNYNAAARSKFDADANIIPAADMAQLIHEAAVHNVEKVVLAVLFGGQEFQTFSFHITDTMKDEFIKDMAVYWGHVKAKVPLTPETVEQAKTLYKADTGGTITANQSVERAAVELKNVKARIKELEAYEDTLQTSLLTFMNHNAVMCSVDGTVLATWKAAKPSKVFNKGLFEQTMPDIYKQFVAEQPGSRRFLLK